MPEFQTVKPELTPEQLQQAQTDMQRLKLYFPFRIVWAYLDGGLFVAQASTSKRTMNAFVRKGYTVLVLEI